MPDIFELFGPARITTANGQQYWLLATTASVEVERRIVEQKRPGVDGAPLDDQGANPKVYNLRILFADGHGRAEIPTPTYPDYHEKFLAAVDNGDTVTTYFPGRGEKRVKIKRLASEQTAMMRNAEVVTLLCLEDREDERPTADSFVLPSAKSAGPVVARQFLAAAETIGLGGDFVDAVERFAAELEAAAQSPFDSAAEIQDRADRLQAACERVESIGSKVQDRANALAFAPLVPGDAGLACRLLKKLQGVAAAHRTAIYGVSTTQARAFARTVSIYEVAQKLGQPVEDLIRMNARLPSLLSIPPGTKILTKAA